MISFPRGKRSEPPEGLPGSYKGRRRTREVADLVRAECPCGWKSRLLEPEKAEEAYQGHLARCPRQGWD